MRVRQRRDDGSDGHNLLLLDGSLSVSQPAEHSTWIENSCRPKGQPAPEVRWYTLELELDAHETNRGYQSRQLFQSLPSILLLGLFIKGKWNSTIFKAKPDPQLLLMLNELFSCVPITASTAILLLERCVHVLMGSFLGQTADREAN